MKGFFSNYITSSCDFFFTLSKIGSLLPEAELQLS